MTAAVAASPALPAASSSFYTAMRILPPPQRDAMYAIYAFCRAVDDVADGDASDIDMPRAARLAELDRWRADVDHLFSGTTPARLAALAEPVHRFDLKAGDFHAVIDGMAMDATENIVAPDWQTLDLYCDRVASAVGRLSTRIFGMKVAEGEALAHHLGRALQLTNILRDLDEDRALGRLYLPREALRQAGIEDTAPEAVLEHPQLGLACALVAERATGHFDEADRIMDGASRRTVRAPRLMAAAYRSILDGLLARGWAPPRQRVRVGRLRIIGALLQHGLP